MGAASRKFSHQKAGRAAVRFADLDIGERFDFDRDSIPTRIIAGPFVKTSPRKFRAEGLPEAKELLLSRPGTAVIRLR